MIIWHLSWHFVLFINSKHCFHCNFNIFVTKPFILCQKSAESWLSVCYYFAGVSHYFFEAKGSNSIWSCSKGQLKLRHFLLLSYSAIDIKSYPSQIIYVLCRDMIRCQIRTGCSCIILSQMSQISIKHWNRTSKPAKPVSLQGLP